MHRRESGSLHNRLQAASVGSQALALAVHYYNIDRVCNSMAATIICGICLIFVEKIAAPCSDEHITISQYFQNSADSAEFHVGLVQFLHKIQILPNRQNSCSIPLQKREERRGRRCFIGKNKSRVCAILNQCQQWFQLGCTAKASHNMRKTNKYFSERRNQSA